MKRTFTYLQPFLIIIVCVFFVWNKGVTQTADESKPFVFSTWMTYSSDKSEADYQKEFARLRKNGISEILINTGGDPGPLNTIVPLAKENGLKVHAWMMTVNRPGDSIALQHPDWYMVNRNGESCFDERPYVGYYQWLCPTRKASREHILKKIETLAKVDGIESYHLDYIRYPDIFLPVGLLPKYDLEQNEELPRFDYCYCEVCISTFEEMHHKNPLEMEHPELDIEWKQFRLNQIKKLVNDAYKIVHENGKILTGAVFPYPGMADHMVRQRWDKWNIDRVYPMIYHNFYNEELDWIGFATQQGVADLKQTNTELMTGLFLPALSADELKKAIDEAKNNGANGVSFFDAGGLTDEKLAIINTYSIKNE